MKKTIFGFAAFLVSVCGAWAQPNWENHEGLKISPAMEEGSFANGTVFYQIQNKKEGYLSTASMQGDNLLFTTTGIGEDAARWAIFGNAEEGFQFVNKATKQAIGMNKFEVTNEENQSDATSSYLTNDFTDASTRFAMAAHKYTSGYWVITAQDDHYFYWNQLKTLGYWYSGENYEYGWYGWKRDETNKGDNGASFRFVEVENIVSATYSVSFSGVPDGYTPEITVDGTSYVEGASFTLSHTISAADVTATEIPGYYYTVEIAAENVILVIYAEIPPYPVSFTNVAHTRTEREVTEIKLGEQSISINGAGMVYQDLTNEDGFTIEAGTTVKPSIIWNGSWMHGFVYIDADSSDRAFTVEEMVSSTPHGNANCDLENGFSEFTVPNNAGDYRMRFKIDWMDENPEGANTLVRDGGYVIDVMLHVTGYTEGINHMVATQQAATFDLQGRSVVKLPSTKGLFIQNGKKLMK